MSSFPFVSDRPICSKRKNERERERVRERKREWQR